MTKLHWDLLSVELDARPTEALDVPAGLSLADLPTPALLIDADALDRNLDAMSAHLASHGKGARPHSKTHKCPPLAKKQIERGAVGICCAKPSEALVMVRAGVKPVLLTSPVLDPDKLALLCRENIDTAEPDITLVIDSELGLERAEQAARDAGAQLGVVIDIDVAMGRTGTRSVDDLLRFAERAAASNHLVYQGVQHYAGHVQHIQSFNERRDASLALWAEVEQRIDALDNRGMSPGIVTGAGTGTFDIDVAVDRLTDLQVGSYAVMDQEYRVIESSAADQFVAFEPALTVLCSVISEPTDVTATVDGGYKSFASDTVPPEPLDLAGARFVFGGDEHGIVIPAKGSQQPLLGERLRFIAPHCDPTVNLYDVAWLHSGSDVIARWPISARGCSW